MQSYLSGGASVHACMRHASLRLYVSTPNGVCITVMVQLFYNSCAQIIHRIRQVAPLCTAM